MKLINRTLFAGALATALIAGGNSILAQNYPNAPAPRTGRTPVSKNGTLSSEDAKFVRDVAAADQAEIEMGQIGVQRAQSADVKQYAQKLVEDHTAQLKQVQELAQQKGVTLPTTTPMHEKHEMNRLKDASAKNFDKDFVKYMVKDHEKDIKDFQKEAASAKDADVKSFASAAVPKLQEHLNTAKQLETAVTSTSGKTVQEPAGSQKKY